MHNVDVLTRFGAAVKGMRARLGISQEELAGRAGLHRTYVSDVERGARNLSLGSIDKLASALQVSASQLFSPDRRPSVVDLKSPEPFGKFASILLVEDDLHDVELTLEAFKVAKFSNPIQVARDGEEALALLFGEGTNAPSTPPLRPDVVLLDLKLPKVSGLEVLRRLKEDDRTRTIPVIVLTASQQGRDYLECQRHGVDGYIVKPVVFENFSQVTPRLRMQWALLKPVSASA